LSITTASDRLQVHITSITHDTTVTLNERVFATGIRDAGIRCGPRPRDALGICEYPLKLKEPT
jgi:hypothetical protein